MIRILMSFHVFIQTTFIINFKSRSARDRMVVTCGKSVVFCRYSFFFHLFNWPTQYCRNVVDGGVKHHNPKSWILENDLAYTYIRFFLTLALNETMSRLMTFTRYALDISIFTTMDNATAYQQILIFILFSVRSKAKYHERLLADDMAGTSW